MEHNLGHQELCTGKRAAARPRYCFTSKAGDGIARKYGLDNQNDGNLNDESREGIKHRRVLSSGI
jgi:hypothetical protein